MRIAIVQHGDYLAARRLLESGAEEPYFGMRHSLLCLQELVGDQPHLLVSLNASASREVVGPGCYLGLPCPALCAGIPKTAAMIIWGRAVRAAVAEFAPTHLLLRTAIPCLASLLLKYASRFNVDTLALLTGALDPRRRGLDGFLNRRLIRDLNRPCVRRVGNHKLPATESLLECGLHPEKAVAYDWPGQRQPQDYPEKTHDGGGEAHILYAGAMTFDKGVGELLQASGLLAGQGRKLRLILAGSGKDHSAMAQLADRLCPQQSRFLGQVPNSAVFELMRRASLVVVPTRPQFPEAMPYTITEALASRTPVIASDHPVFRRAFRDGQGMRFFRAGDAKSLAQAIGNVLDSPEDYKQLSRTTAQAFARVQCQVTFGQLLQQWKNQWA